METSTEPYTIFYDASHNAVMMRWEGYSTSWQFRQGTELMLQLLEKHRAARVLADVKNMTLIGMEDQQWLERDFLPRAIKKGFQKLAIIRPENYFNKVAVESVSYKVDQSKLKISFFENVAEASQWLAQQ